MLMLEMQWVFLSTQTLTILYNASLFAVQLWCYWTCCHVFMCFSAYEENIINSKYIMTKIYFSCTWIIDEITQWYIHIFKKRYAIIKSHCINLKAKNLWNDIQLKLDLQYKSNKDMNAEANMSLVFSEVTKEIAKCFL